MSKSIFEENMEKYNLNKAFIARVIECNNNESFYECPFKALILNNIRRVFGPKFEESSYEDRVLAVDRFCIEFRVLWNPYKIDFPMVKKENPK